MEKRPVTILTGPTASGKSAHALRVAESIRAVIINADAMQLYAELPILTAQPSAAERAAVPHCLYGVLDATDPSTAARWVGLAAAEIRRAWEDGAAPVLVGGTGMYLKALMDGIAPVPEIPADIRQQTRARWRDEGNAALHRWLSEVDPVSASRLFPGDTQRLMRAAEVFAATGRPLADWQRDPPAQALPEAEFTIQAISPDRATLYARIDARFESMIAAGAVKEAKALHERHLSKELPLLKAHGVPELFAHLEGRLSLKDAIARAQQNTRNYAKRQWTWLANQFPGAEKYN